MNQLYKFFLYPLQRPFECWLLKVAFNRNISKLHLQNEIQYRAEWKYKLQKQLKEVFLIWLPSMNEKTRNCMNGPEVVEYYRVNQDD